MSFETIYALAKSRGLKFCSFRELEDDFIWVSFAWPGGMRLVNGDNWPIPDYQIKKSELLDLMKPMAGRWRDTAFAKKLTEKGYAVQPWEIKPIKDPPQTNSAPPSAS
ncbi:MAG: hypothetical protein AAGD25_06635 [Cyanobacteria bacterium P01_F01_bin.150]